jgi:hypothetical protein
MRRHAPLHAMLRRTRRSAWAGRAQSRRPPPDLFKLRILRNTANYVMDSQCPTDQDCPLDGFQQERFASDARGDTRGVRRCTV